MGQIISIIFGCLSGGKKRIENGTSHEVYSPQLLPTWYIDIIEEEQHIHNKEEEEEEASAAASFHPHHRVLTTSPQQQQAMLDPPVEDLHQPLITTNSIVADTRGVEETKELTLKATSKEGTSTKTFEWKKIKEKKHIIKSTEEEAFNPHHHVVTISQQQHHHHQHQQQQEKEAVSDPLVEVDLHRPLIATNSIVTDTAGVEETKELILKALEKEATSTKKFEWKIKEKEPITKSTEKEAFHPRHNIVPISQQKHHQQQHHHQKQQQEEQEVVSNPLVDIDLHQPLITTSSIVTDTARVEETKELILKATTEEATSTKRFKWKIKEKNHKNEEVIVRKIGPYVSTQKILLVGEGDFSFSASLAVAFGNASNIVASSLNEKAFLMNNYKKSMVNIERLESGGALVIHYVDATEMAEHKSLKGMKFDRIIFNFPHTCFFGRTPFDIGQNKMLVVGFLKNAKKMIEEDGEIHVTHKTSSAYVKWHIAQLGLMEDLNLIEASPFDPKVYSGYDTKYGNGGDKNFDYFPCNIYKFGLVC